MKSIFERQGFFEPLSKSGKKALRKGGGFLGAASQLDVAVLPIPEGTVLEVHPNGIVLEPWTSYFHIAAYGQRPDRAKAAAELDAIGVKIHQLPNIILNEDGKLSAVRLNAAALMESYAAVYEMNAVINAFRSTSAEALKSIVPDGAVYGAATEYAVRSGACNHSNMILTVQILVDVSLMYDPFVLFNAPTVEKSRSGQVEDQLPGETFIRVCQAALQIVPIVKYDPEDIRRYYRELCAVLGFPSPREMAQKAYDVAAGLLNQNTSDSEAKPLFIEALAVHVAALELRLEDPEFFPVKLATTDGILDIMERVGPHVSFYRMTDLKPSGTFPDRKGPGSWPQNTDVLGFHNLLKQAFVEKQLLCPLKNGEPFRCPSAMDPDDVSCSFVVDNRRIECPAVKFRRVFGAH